MLSQLVIMFGIKKIMEFIDSEERLLRPKNLFEPAPGEKDFRFIKQRMILKLSS